MADSVQLDGTKLILIQKLTNGSMHAGQMNGHDGMNRLVTVDAGSRTKSKNSCNKSGKLANKANLVSSGSVAGANSLLPTSPPVALTLATNIGCDISATMAYQVNTFLL